MERMTVEGFSIRPNELLTVEWQLPLPRIQQAQTNSHIKYSIGILQYSLFIQYNMD